MKKLTKKEFIKQMTKPNIEETFLVYHWSKKDKHKVNTRSLRW